MNMYVMWELKPGVQKTKTKQMENEKWIGDGQKADDIDRQTPLEQGERPTPAEVVTLCTPMQILH